MSFLFQEDLHSSDNEDDDYVPDPEEVSSNDNDENPVNPDDEIQTKKRAKKNNVLISKDRKHTFEKSASAESKVYEKQRANDLFKNFLEEVEAEMKVKESNIFSRNTSDSPVVSSHSGIINSETSYENAPEKSQCELFNFAGETVVISLKDGAKIASTEESAESSFEKNKPLNYDKLSGESPATKRKGLQSVLGSIMNKKQKLTTLEKSSLDWNLFKKEHGISEELKKFNKGRGGYIERQKFLQRSDVKCYEIELGSRLFKGKKNS